MNGRNRIKAALIAGCAASLLGGVVLAQTVPVCDLPGRPDPDAPGENMLRGFIVAWAVNADGEEISWNHLAGTGTIVNYQDQFVWEYNAGSIQAINQSTGDPTDLTTVGRLNLDGVEYAPPYGWLMLNFQAVGSTAFSLLGAGTTPSLSRLVSSTTDLTLMPVELDVQQESDGPVTTKVTFDVWNENEVKFSGAERCLTCWDEFLLDEVQAPHFTRQYLQTDHGKTRFNGLASQNCPGSTAEALWGVAAKLLTLDGNAQLAAGGNMFGMGTEPASIVYDSSGGSPPTGPGDGDWGGLIDEDLGQALDEKESVNDGWSSPLSTGSFEQMDSPFGPSPVQDRMSGSEKGSVLFFPKVEVRWDDEGDVIQDTLIQLTNDFNGPVYVQMYFVNGDDPVMATGDDPPCNEPGWNWVNNKIPVTANQPLYWSAATGQPTGVSPWWVLDP